MRPGGAEDVVSGGEVQKDYRRWMQFDIEAILT